MAPEGRDAPVPDLSRPARWDRRPVLSATLRAVVFVVPIASSVGAATVLGRLLPRGDSGLAVAWWITLIVAGSLLTLLVLERLVRRLLPLAALLNLSLIFPDKAPTRFAIARKTGRPRDLQASLDQAHASHQYDQADRVQMVIGLVLALSVHDRASRGHSERVRVFTDLLSDELKLPEDARDRLRWAALLHDIGKLEVPAGILNKPGRPNDDEWSVLHRHPVEGARRVAALLPWLGEWGAAVEQHHERFDGTGYPHQLKGSAISLAARIVAVADSYEVMTAPRAYKRAMSVSAARKELVRVAGTQLDPAIVRAFLNVSVGRLWRTVGVGAWVGQVPTVARLLNFGGFGGAAAAAAPAMGIATAATTVLAFSGLVGPATVPATLTTTGAQASLSVAAAPSDPLSQGHQLRPRPVAPSAAPSPTDAPAPTPDVPATAPVLLTAPPPSRPTATPAGTQPPATAAPAADPWSCAACTNTASTCTSYCSGDAHHCVTFCAGHENPACTSHCFGESNEKCTQYCAGNHDPACQQNCRPAPSPSPAVSHASRRPALLQADAVLTSTTRTTNAMVMRPLY